MTEKITNSIINETVLKYVHKSGVTVFMLPMRGFSTTTAHFSAKFGSQDNAFSVNGGDIIRVPDGTAHYLEHKLFESEEKGAFEMFAQTGASCNAGTSFDLTTYHFCCASNFNKNLEILLGFVQDPYFTPENVEKERGIIGQEITMYRDNPGWRVFTNLLEGLYSVNPVRNDIAGTIESVSQITEKTLYDCYNAFYNPSNMYLCVTGNFDPDEVVSICEEKLKDRQSFDVKPAAFDEPPEVNQKRMELIMPVAKPIFEIGFKRTAPDPDTRAEDNIYFNILFDVMFSGMSDFYERMRESGVINEEFSVGVFDGRGYLFPFARGESDDPDRVLEEMQKEIRKFKKTPPSKDLFDCVKKGIYGAMVRSFNNTLSAAETLVEAVLGWGEPFTVFEAAASANYETLLEKLNGLDESNACISIIKGE